MQWDNYYEWRSILLLSSWVKGVAFAVWLPAVAAALCLSLLRNGFLHRRWLGLIIYTVIAGGWVSILWSLPSTNAWSPVWEDAASITCLPLALAGLATVALLPVSVTADSRRGFDVVRPK